MKVNAQVMKEFTSKCVDVSIPLVVALINLHTLLSNHTPRHTMPCQNVVKSYMRDAIS